MAHLNRPGLKKCRAAGNKVRRKSASRAGCVGETHNNKNKEPGRGGSTSGG